MNQVYASRVTELKYINRSDSKFGLKLNSLYSWLFYGNRVSHNGDNYKVSIL